MSLCLDSHADVRQCEIGCCLLRHGNIFYRVAGLLVGCGIEGIVEFHVGVEGIVLRPALLFLHTVVERGTHLGLVGEELSELNIRCDTVSAYIICRPAVDTVLQSAESFAAVLSLHVHRSEVRELQVKVSLCRPATFVVVVEQSQFVDPHLTALGVVGKVAHTDNHCLHLTDCRVTHDGHLVVRVVAVVDAELTVVAAGTLRHSYVALLLQLGENIERDVEHIVLRPHHPACVEAVAVVVAWGGELQRNLILIVVVLIIGSETHKYG